MLRKIKGRRRRGDRGWDGWMASLNSMDMSLRKLWETVMNKEAWPTAVHGVTRSETRLSDWTATMNETKFCSHPFCEEGGKTKWEMMSKQGNEWTVYPLVVVLSALEKAEQRSGMRRTEMECSSSLRKWHFRWYLSDKRSQLYGAPEPRQRELDMAKSLREGQVWHVWLAGWKQREKSWKCG